MAATRGSVLHTCLTLHNKMGWLTNIYSKIIVFLLNGTVGMNLEGTMLYYYKFVRLVTRLKTITFLGLEILVSGVCPMRMPVGPCKVRYHILLVVGFSLQNFRNHTEILLVQAGLGAEF